MLTSFAAAVIGLLLCAAVSDVMFRRIPNVVPGAIAVLYIAAAILFPHDINWLQATGFAVVVFAIGAALFAMGKVGGGDVKLLAAYALWAGLSGIGPFLVITAMAGGVVALAQLAPQAVWYVTSVFGTTEHVAEAPSLKSLPYGIAIATGGSFAVLTQLILI